MAATGATRPLSATLITFAAAYLDRALRFAVLMVAGRAAGPAGLGVMLLALLSLDIVQALGDAGFARPLLQRQRIRRDVVDTAFTLSTANGALLSLAVYLLAGPVSTFAAQPDLGPLLRLLSIVPLANGLGQVPDILLQRHKQFRVLAVRTAVSSVVGALLAGAAIWGGETLLILIVGQAAQALIGTAISWWTIVSRPRLRWHRALAVEIARRAAQLWASGVMSFLNGRGFDFIAGFSLGATALASLRIAGQIVLMVVQVTVGPSLAVATSLLPRSREQPERFRSQLLLTALGCATLIFPAFAGLFAVADTVLPSLLGAKWADLAQIMPFMCLIAPALYFQVMMIAVLFSFERNDLLVRFAAFELVSTLVFGLVGSAYGLIGIAAAGSLRLYVLAPIGWRWLHRKVGVNPNLILLAAVPSLVASALMLATITAMKAGLAGGPMSPLYEGGLLVGAGMLVYLVCVAIIYSTIAMFIKPNAYLYGAPLGFLTQGAIATLTRPRKQIRQKI